MDLDLSRSNGAVLAERRLNDFAPGFDWPLAEPLADSGLRLVQF